MEVDDDPMEVAMRQELVATHQPSADPGTEVMLDAVDDYLGADFGNLGEINQPKYTISSSHGNLQPVMQNSSIGIDSFSSFGGGAPPGGSLDALGLAGMELAASGQGSLSSPALDSSPRPIGFFGAPIVPDAPPSMMSWDVQLKAETSESPGSIASADGTGSAGPGSVGSFGPGSDIGDTRRRSDVSETSTSASTTPTGTGPRKARATRRRKSAPDLALAVNPNSQKNFKKEYHNRAERERTRKINNSIQEIRGLTGCVETDKVSILESATKCITDINAGTYIPSPRVTTVASRANAAASSSAKAMSVVVPTQQSPPSTAPAAAPPALPIQPDAYRDISPLLDVLHIAAAMVSPDLRITAANQSMAAVIGCDCSELEQQPFLACFHPEDVAHASRTMRHLQQQHFSHRQQLAAQAQIAAHAAAAQAAAAQAVDGLNTPPPPLQQPQIAPLQAWEVLTLRIARADRTMVPASCRISLVLSDPAQDSLGFSFLIDGKQEYKQHDF